MIESSCLWCDVCRHVTYTASLSSRRRWAWSEAVLLTTRHRQASALHVSADSSHKLIIPVSMLVIYCLQMEFVLISCYNCYSLIWFSLIRDWNPGLKNLGPTRLSTDIWQTWYRCFKPMINPGFWRLSSCLYGTLVTSCANCEIKPKNTDCQVITKQRHYDPTTGERWRIQLNQLTMISVCTTAECVLQA